MAGKFYQQAIPLIPLNPVRNSARFDYLKGRLLSEGDPVDFEQAEEFFQKSIMADEASGAVVLAAQTRYYLALLLSQKGEIERSHAILTEINGKFENWRIPFWQKKCERALEICKKGKV